MTKAAFNRSKILFSRSMNQSVKKKTGEAVVWSVLLYGSETWTMESDMIQKIGSIEMWVWRRTEKISRSERKTNE